MGYFKQYKNLPREIYIVAFARLINSLGFFIYAFLTLFLSRKLNFPEDAIGRFLLVAAVVGIPGVILGGKLADKFSRKAVFVIANTLSSVIFIVVGFLGESQIIPYLIIIAGFFSSFAWPALSAMIMDYTTPENRQASFSLGYLAMNIGVAIGPAVAGLLFENHIEWIFWGDALTTLGCVLVVMIALKDRDITEREKSEDLSETEQAFTGSTFKALLKRPTVIIFAVLCSILAFVYAQAWFALPLHTAELFDTRGAEFYGYLISINGLVVVFFTPILLLLTKHFRPVINMMIAGAIYAVGFGIYGFTSLFSVFIVATVVWTLGEIMGSINGSVYIANHSPVTHRGRFQSIFDIINGTGRAIGPLLAGMFLLGHSLNQLWFLIILISAVGAVSLYGLYLYENVLAKRKNELAEE